jgi:hypothetical protein
LYWTRWRECYRGGEHYVNRNLERFSDLETDPEFNTRKDLTPIQTFAAAAIDDVRNSIFQRLVDVTRLGGSKAYFEATQGLNGGIDNRGSSMRNFMGIDVLTELLVMGRVGIYIDAPEVAGPSLAEAQGIRPYVYYYPIEDILSWDVTKPEEPGDFKAVLLRDTGLAYTQAVNLFNVQLPSGSYQRLRLLWKDENRGGKVNLQFFDADGTPTDKDGNKRIFVYKLDLDNIPFTMPDIGHSLTKNIYKHQKALLNLCSSDVSYCLKANHPFLTIQRDARLVGRHLKRVTADDGTSVTSENDEPGSRKVLGTRLGHYYGTNEERPGFIHPSSEPLVASMQLQEKLEDDIRKLVNLAVQNKSGRRHAAREIAELSDQGIEAGLAYIAGVLEGSERQIATHWAAYENRVASKRQIATVSYPSRYTLKSEADRIKEAGELAELMFKVPGRTVKHEIAKQIVGTLLGGSVPTTQLEKIAREITSAAYTTSDPDTIIRAVEAGLCSEETGSLALGFKDGEHLKAREDHIERAKRIAEAQGQAKANMAERGVPDMDEDPNSTDEEKDESQDDTMKDEKGRATRGEGKAIDKKGDE